MSPRVNDNAGWYKMRNVKDQRSTRATQVLRGAGKLIAKADEAQSAQRRLADNMPAGGLYQEPELSFSAISAPHLPLQ
jgi:hypothetical protein